MSHSRSFYKDYPNRKDWIKPYRRPKNEFRRKVKDTRSMTTGCCNNNSCGYCNSNRTWFDTKHRKAADVDLKEYYDETDDYYQYVDRMDDRLYLDSY